MNFAGNDIITLKNAKIVQKNFTVLSQVDLHIKRGTFCYIIGKTGSGKSSLLKVLYGHLPLKEGEGEVVGLEGVARNDHVAVLGHLRLWSRGGGGLGLRI